MAYTITPLSGVNLVGTTTTNTNSAGTAIPTFGPLGAEVFGSDGKRYVFAQAGGAITASTATCTINASTFVATGTGGSSGAGSGLAATTAYVSKSYSNISINSSAQNASQAHENRQPSRALLYIQRIA